MFFRFSIKSIWLWMVVISITFSVESVMGKPFVVVIDPGHGGRDAGAVSSVVKEKEINLAVALLLGELINSNHSDVEIVYTRKTDKFVTLDRRATIANKAKGDLFISIHANSIKKNSRPHGAETYTLGLSKSKENLEVAKRENSVILLEDNYKRTYEGFDPNSSESYIMFEFMQNKYMDQSIVFASYVQKELKRTAKRSDRGVRQAEFLVLRETSMPSVLIELGFITNPEEAKYMKSTSGRKQLAGSIYNAFKQYKTDYDKKQKALAEKKRRSSGNKNFASKNDLIYKVQILTSEKKLSLSSPQLKGYNNVSYYKQGGLYKYTCGESSDLNEILKIKRSVQKDFKGAFVIEFKDGIRQN